MSNVYRVAIEVTGNINGQRFTGSGHSVGDARLGTPEVCITYSSIPNGSNVLGNFIAIINMLSTLLSREIPPAKGFLSLTGGDYGFARTVQGPTVDLHAAGSMQRVGKNDLRLTSSISGTIAQPPTAAIKKWLGIQLPDGPGRVREVMTVPLRFEDGTEEIVCVATSYVFDPSVNLPSLQVREVELDAKMSDLKLDAKFMATIRTATTKL
jgi:hypothetical protein